MKRFQSIFSLASVISLLCSVIWLSPAVAAAPPVFSSLGQIKVDALRIPGAMDLDESGNLYVADARAKQVHVFDTYGALKQSFDLEVAGRGVAVAADGSMLYASRQQSVVMFNLATGEVVGELAGAEAEGAEFVVAGEIDLDAVGNVFVADTGKMVVKVYGATGDFKASFGGVGTGNGQFKQIGGMTINPFGQVVVGDSSSMNNKVHVFTLNPDLSVNSVVSYANNSTASFGSPTMIDPRGMAFDELGRGYLLAFMRSQVRVVNESFGYLGVYGETGVGVGQLGQLGDAIFDNVNKRLFVGCDSGRIEILGVDGGANPEYVNNAPTAPVPQSPIGGTEVGTTQPVLSFASATDADGDELTYFAKVTLNGELVFEGEAAAVAGAMGSVVVDSDLQENTQYAWTVKAFDNELYSPESMEAVFVVNAVDEIPEAPVLLSPLENASVSGADLLSWTATDDPDPSDYVVNYRLEVSSAPDFSTVLLAEDFGVTDVALGDLLDYSLLVDGESYFWRVTAFDKADNGSVGGAVGQFMYDTTGLSITANVPGVNVYVGGSHAYDGQLIGVAPLELRDVAAGTYSVVLERPGLEPYVTSVSVAEGDNVSLSGVLVPAMQVDTLPAKDRWINGRSGLAVDGNAAPFLVDYNSDGVLDLLVGDASGQITLFADMVVDGRDRLYFSPGVTVDLPALPGAVPFVVDWNNDGLKDLLVGVSDGTVKLFVNAGSQSAPAFGFGEELTLSGDLLDVGASAAPAVVDLNSDGMKDLLVGNADGDVLAYINNGTDDAPALVASGSLFTVGGAAVPMPVDWDADGTQEIMVTAAGETKIYARQADGTYQALPVALGNTKGDSFAAFPADCDGGRGKEVIVGALAGRIFLLKGNNDVPVASFKVAVQEKLDELGALVADEAPESLGEITTISAFVGQEDYVAALDSMKSLVKVLPAGDAQQSATQLMELLR